MYKGTNPTCHDFNTANMTCESVNLLVGFSTGQVQLIDPIKKELSKLYNEEVSIVLDDVYMERRGDSRPIVLPRYVGPANVFYTSLIILLSIFLENDRQNQSDLYQMGPWLDESLPRLSQQWTALFIQRRAPLWYIST